MYYKSKKLPLIELEIMYVNGNKGMHDKYMCKALTASIGALQLNM